MVPGSAPGVQGGLATLYQRMTQRAGVSAQE
jgi:hypothetical protein